mmetsp:Transcript_82971/g.130851  ORF Transcript_82971/g.130851 Transcript_82971/m.130851 type:complete len:247 (+) Transcript_82971:1582-2322(+)
MTYNLLENTPHHRLEGIQYVILRDERHLAIDLREFWLAIGTELFVAETLHDLEVAIHACDHEKLLESLWRLRQRIKLTRIHTRRHHEISSSLRCGLYQNWRLHLNKACLTQVFPHNARNSVSQKQCIFDRVSSDIEISIAHTCLLLCVCFIFDFEWRHFARIQYYQAVCNDLNVASRTVFVLVTSLDNFASNFNDELATQLGRFFIPLDTCRVLTILGENDLCYAVSVTQIDKTEMVHVTASLHPA